MSFSPRNKILGLGLLLLAFGVAHEATAAERLLAVLPLDVRFTKGRMDEAARRALEDLIRDEAANALSSSGWTVLSGENTYAVLRDNGVDPTHCGEGECHVQTARELNVEMFLSGAVQFVDDQLVASIRLMVTKTGRIVASERLEGTNTTALFRVFQGGSKKFFERAGLIGESVPTKDAAAPQSPPVSGGFIEIAVTPSTARVTVDGQLTGAGQAGPYDAGRHSVRATAEGHAPAAETVVVKNGAKTAVSLNLTALPGRLRVTTDVAARCNAGSVELQAGPNGPAVFDLPAGVATIVCHADGAEDVSRQVSLAAGGVQDLLLSLPTKPASPPPVTLEVPEEQHAVAETVTVPPAALKAPPAGPTKGFKWGWIALGAAAVVAGASVAFDTSAPTSHDRRLAPVDFAPLVGYAAALSLSGVGIYNVVTP